MLPSRGAFWFEPRRRDGTLVDELRRGESSTSMSQTILLTSVFGQTVSGTWMIFAGLGCPNGCDFCCTSHFFSRKHVRLLPEGKDIYAVIERYHDLNSNLVFVILDEDFLLNKKRAMAFRDCVMKGGRTVSIFAFSSIKAISQYTVEEILEMGINGFWIGYEGTRSNYAKQQGRPIAEILTEFREHGITILAYRSRIRVVLPDLSAAHPELLLLAGMFHHYKI